MRNLIDRAIRNLTILLYLRDKVKPDDKERLYEELKEIVKELRMKYDIQTIQKVIYRMRKEDKGFFPVYNHLLNLLADL